MEPRRELRERMVRIRRRIDRRLDRLVPDGPGDPVRRSMRYSLLAPGKRVRPTLTLLTCEAFGGDARSAVDAACAIEMVHAASLMLDDLPAMDDAVERRGRAANHRVFGEDVTTLAAFSLLNRSFAVLAGAKRVDSGTRLKLIETLTAAIGDEGIIAGQMRDLRSDLERTDPSAIERMHVQKTASLFVAAVEMGARAAGVAGSRLEPVRTFASNFGLFFQVLDDLVDQLATAEAAGKDVGKDSGKATFATSLGPARARSEAERFAAAAARALDPIGPAGATLAGVARSLLESTPNVVSRIP